MSSNGSTTTTPTIARTTCDLHDRYVGDTHTFSFVASSVVFAIDGGNLSNLLSHCVNNEGIMTGILYLLSIGAGSEPFVLVRCVYGVKGCWDCPLPKALLSLLVLLLRPLRPLLWPPSWRLAQFTLLSLRLHL